MVHWIPETLQMVFLTLSGVIDVINLFVLLLFFKNIHLVRHVLFKRFPNSVGVGDIMFGETQPKTLDNHSLFI